ncbi:hypothetical protein IEU95_03580 [Hoyosella rhizosphaerae]|uniref:Protein-tyrosine-phosphatase n=1 Tax=Hoyosella rhizosphaerae TaxID=1755582 RepID=A0A916XE74_9ACTN|nr:hypothetical protein [Hoyosella rhizosphaerae]MBN4925896.1 hypothetical protein [Hoyosella rhizosphaerae]GGC67115.1 protein-tyrosine-phosphatase [Hoyosella rhizosphaerae]
MRILFVCTGNICRSPVAERYARFWADTHNAKIDSSSVGTHALVGHPIDELAAQALRELGGDPSDFEAKQLTPQLAAEADLILTMQQFHRDRVLAAAPTAMLRTFMLSEAAIIVEETEARTVKDMALARMRVPHARNSPGVADPFDQSIDTHRDIAAEIATKIATVLSALVSQAKL